MNLKIDGRYEGIEDNREFLCKKCFCKEHDIVKEEYDEMIVNFMDEGCPLF